MSDLPASTSCVVEVQACTTMPNLRGAGDRTQSFLHVRQAFHQLTYTPALLPGLLRLFATFRW